MFYASKSVLQNESYRYTQYKKIYIFLVHITPSSVEVFIYLYCICLLIFMRFIHSFDSIEHQFLLFGFFPLTLLFNVVPSFPTHTSFVSFICNREKKTNNFESKKKKNFKLFEASNLIIEIGDTCRFSQIELSWDFE